MASPSYDRPVFEVSFWRRTGTPDTPGRLGGYEEEPWHVRDADIDQVLRWAHTEVGPDRMVTIRLAPHEHEVANHLPSRWLYGVDPVAGDRTPGRGFTRVTPADLDDPIYDLFTLPPRLKRLRRRHRWNRRVHRLTGALARSVHGITERWST